MRENSSIPVTVVEQMAGDGAVVEQMAGDVAGSSFDVFIITVYDICLDVAETFLGVSMFPYFLSITMTYRFAIRWKTHFCLITESIVKNSTFRVNSQSHSTVELKPVVHTCALRAANISSSKYATSMEWKDIGH
ncbi:hypothetical protein RRG08_001500 [Elysia crispata]|uniref:Uncharacterized protein n=1 Tax=Elysia crispata TaxID=231223 RepID=A0AAE1AAW4_9GAST|nr:hypothetical protein RRG08_001500 [Elysia crispata]